MSRSLRFFVVGLAAVALVGTASLAMACDGQSSAATCTKSASVEKASTGASCSSAKQASAKTSCSSEAKACAGVGCCAKGASAKAASAETGYCSVSALTACAASGKLANGACQPLAKKTAVALANYTPFQFVNAAQERNVALGVQPTDSGIAIVFAGGSETSVASAKQLANQSVESIGKPAHCSFTRSSMAKEAGGCKTTQACLSALADADITVIETPNGAITSIASKDAAKIAELHKFLASLTPVESGDSE